MVITRHGAELTHINANEKTSRSVSLFFSSRSRGAVSSTMPSMWTRASGSVVLKARRCSSTYLSLCIYRALIGDLFDRRPWHVNQTLQRLYEAAWRDLSPRDLRMRPIGRQSSVLTTFHEPFGARMEPDRSGREREGVAVVVGTEGMRMV